MLEGRKGFCQVQKDPEGCSNQRKDPRMIFWPVFMRLNWEWPAEHLSISAGMDNCSGTCW